MHPKVYVKPVYRIQELAKDFGTSATTVYEAIRNGELKAFTLGRQLRVAGEDAMKWRDAMRSRSGEAA